VPTFRDERKFLCAPVRCGKAFQMNRSRRSGPRCGRMMGTWLATVTGPVALLACVAPPTSDLGNPFVGNWVTAENARITIRPDTVVQHQADGETTVLDQAACRGVFRFTYGTKSRQALANLVPRQPELRQRLSDELLEQSYPTAELDCDRGDQTYVLLNDHQLLAIYRDGDLGAIERLGRR
jgi:hypothetical protein